jgi:uncharacterized protein YukE
MTTLDETYDAIAHFARSLAEFNEALRTSAAELADRHGVLEGVWSDNAARSYAQLYEPLNTALQHYLAHEAPRMEDFIQAKVRILDAYLHGR